MKKLSEFMLSLLLLMSSLQLAAQPDCRSKVEDYITRYKTALSNFIPDPGTDKARDDFLKALQHINPGLYDKVVRIAKEGAVNEKIPGWIECFTQEFRNIMPEADNVSLLLWSGHLFKKFTQEEMISPEFERGLGIHVDINQGVADLGKKTEAYSFAARALLTYTFSPNANGQGGHLRAMGGISTYYQDNEFLWFANPRLEYRLTDIGNKLTTLGNVKAIVDANFGKTWIAGAGAGLELHNFGLQVLYQWQGDDKDNHILVGLFYRFLK